MTDKGIKRVAIDAMGGDYGVEVMVPGGIEAVRELSGKAAVAFVGDGAAIRAELEKHDTSGIDELISVIEADGFVEESDRPLRVVGTKPRASIFVAAAAASEGQVDGFLSAGPTGATFLAANLALGTLEGVGRGALCGNFLGFAENTFIMDLGAQIDVLPTHFVKLATLGCSGIGAFTGEEKTPRVGLLNVGTEPGKGNRQAKEIWKCLDESDLNFIGNVEPEQLVNGEVDLVICDGFVGNILMKYSDALAGKVREFMEQKIGDREEFRPMIDELQAKMSVASTIGGCPILGVDGLALVLHGASSVETVKISVGQILTYSERSFVERQKSALSSIRIDQDD